MQVEVRGVEADNQVQKTSTIRDNGFHPVWNETLPEFQITCPDLALVMFQVIDEQSFRRNDVTIAQYCLPLNCMQTGYRMVLLRDSSGNKLNPTSLFVHISVK